MADNYLESSTAGKEVSGFPHCPHNCSAQFRQFWNVSSVLRSPLPCTHPSSLTKPAKAKSSAPGAPPNTPKAMGKPSHT